MRIYFWIFLIDPAELRFRFLCQWQVLFLTGQSTHTPYPMMVGNRSPDGMVVGSCTSHPGVLGSQAPSERNQGKQGATLTRSSSSCHPPFTQYPVPSRSLVRDGQTSPHVSWLVVPHSTCPSLSPSPPRTQLYNMSCSNKHNTRDTKTVRIA
jgi:hypothetical protein